MRVSLPIVILLCIILWIALMWISVALLNLLVRIEVWITS